MHDQKMSEKLSDSAIRIMKSTAPTLSTEGTKVTSRMYEIMFSKYPVVKNLFNASHFQKAGNNNTVAPQAQALANAVIGYAANADNLSALQETLQLIAHKHVSFNILPEHYPIVGDCLLQAIKDVLQDAATEEVMEGWKEGYNFLADLFIGMENNIKKENESKGGWIGFKPLLVSEKIKETDEITSFILKDPTGKDLPEFLPGQYISFRIPVGKIEKFDHDIVRNYSLSSMPNHGFYRVSIKKELSHNMCSPDGVASVYFHDNVNVGDEVLVGNPCGTFVLKGVGPRPLVLISAGVGLTPIISMMEFLLSNQDNRKPIVYIHCAKSEAHFAMRLHVEELCKNKRLTSHVFYSNCGAGALGSKIVTHNSRLTKEALESIISLPSDENEFYFCGPPRFLHFVRGILSEMEVPAEQINYEYFGPTQE